MSQPVLLKVYGSIWPADEAFAGKLGKILESCLPEPDAPPVFLRDDMLVLSFEGIFFPLEDALAFLEEALEPCQNGKLDYLDLENWKMTRWRVENGRLSESGAPLNNVLDYSGH